MNNDLNMVLDIKKIHPFPARMAPEILSGYLSKQKIFNVFDPMVGSGTSLVNALAHGHNVTGTDLDPLACLLTKVWCSRTTFQNTDAICKKILARVTAKCRSLDSAKAYPRSSDHETRQFIKFWFDSSNRRQLTLLAQEISKIDNKKVKDLLWVAFSRLIIAKKRGVSLAMDLSHSRPHKAFKKAPITALEHFYDSVQFVVKAQRHNRKILKSAKIVIKRGDARNTKVKSNSQDLVLTSPPYLNAIDYMRCSKFALVWMGYNLTEIRSLRSSSIGSERSRIQELTNLSDIEKIIATKMKIDGLSDRKKNLITRYSYDLEKVFMEVNRVLKKNGRAVVVIGNCFIENTKINNAELATQLAIKSGMRLISKKSRIIPPNKRYMPPPSKSKKSGMNARMREEIVLEFKK